MTAPPHSRRHFLSLTAGGAALWATRAFGSDARPDFVVHNARVYTVDDRFPRAQALAVKDDRFLAVGSDAEVRALAGPSTKVLDAKGMTVVPGFIDCHIHADGKSLLYEVVVGDPYGTGFSSIDDIVAKLKARADKTPPGVWVTGYFYDDVKTRDGRPLNVRDLDRVSSVHPVVVRHRGGHTSFYNSVALRMAGLSRATPDVPGGTYDRFPDGELNGRVTDNARLVFDKVGKPMTWPPEEAAQREREGAAFLSQKFAEFGLTGVCHQGGSLRALQEIRAEGRLKHRVNYECYVDVWEPMIAAGMRTGLGDAWIRLGGTAERSTDGSLSERTMAMSVAFPGTSYKGNLKETQEAVNAWVEKMHRAGIRVNVHANGDVTIAQALTAFERAQSLWPRKDPRFKITHCSLVDEALARRIKAAGVTPALFNTYLYFNADKFSFYGEDLMGRMMAYRTLLDAGVPVCAGSDFGAGVFPPLMGMQGVVTRTGWDGKTWGAGQRITVAEALKVHTLNGAYDTMEEDLKGSITPGKLADFVVLGDDPHTVEPNRIKDIRIERTVVGGATVYQA
ncbi:MAG: amidohydrolase [Phenylobacterium sp.]|uniref:amidohydrolase n=1 Tax=Phenylobacterium sp. TaxID=1871053 RepID=UPI001A39447E|nr:amidohydrolase [Phenylobacterium sp.]MBL8774030.1 amidohydrolase [Phenylobacterium sp.]